MSYNKAHPRVTHGQFISWGNYFVERILWKFIIRYTAKLKYSESHSRTYGQQHTATQITPILKKLVLSDNQTTRENNEGLSVKVNQLSTTHIDERWNYDYGLQYAMWLDCTYEYVFDRWAVNFTNM